jgi:5-hydroxyisourate hydrolase-like protein (transthyretin family)
VDGEPAASLEIECVPESDAELKRPVISVTDAEGKFSIGTYESGDGLPEGTYVLVFRWVELGIGATDKLKGAYADPKKSEFKVTVAAGETNDLGEIALSSSGPEKS